MRRNSMPNYPAPFGNGLNASQQDGFPPSLTTYDTIVTTTAATPCSAAGTPASFLVAIENAAAAQTATYTFYDNASAASGQIVFTAVTPGAGQVIIFGGNGIALANGCTVSASLAAVGAGIRVTVR
jgi:hypothetical protein